MTTLRFKCILHSDLVLSELASTEGIQRTLDYIPGSVFLGVVAGKIYSKVEPQVAMDLFHNAKVRFGDALPLVNEKRAIKVPTSWFVKKGESLKSQVYIHDQLPDEQKKTEPYVQLREKFIVRDSDNLFSEIELRKSFAIKSAYDSNSRRSLDQQMYGYQSLEAGMELSFQVEFDEDIPDDLVEKVKNCLLAQCTIGRSKTAQYGLVEIVPVEDKEIKPGFKEYSLNDSGYTFLYAESRLLFLDEENGQPIIPTEGKYFGMEGATVDLERSQIRTFRYSPYNFKRQSRDADRFGIEKGSVICINRVISKEEAARIKQGLGLYRNEGFGKVLINPEFLTSEKNGKAKFAHFGDEEINDRLEKSEKATVVELEFTQKTDSGVWQYLKQQQVNKANQQSIYSAVNKFVNSNQKRFEKEVFASQWGTIRSIAAQTRNYEDLKNELYCSSGGYLVHGVVKDKWEDMGRLETLKKFIEKFEPQELASEAVVNLAAEMAKKCRRNKHG
jgi:hypothetical protein